MIRHRSFAVALVATTLLGSAAYAVEQAPHTATQESPAQKAIDRDVGKLSKDGAQAFRDIHLARVAIFEANPTQAKDFIGKAQAALVKAKADDAVFNKAEADLKTPAQMTGATPTAQKPAATDAKAGATPTTAGQTAWIPVDAQLTLGEDFQATPAKASAISDANKHLASGDRKAALEKLRLADVDVNFVMAVLPLDKTATDVNQAATLIDQGKYYEANALLKTTENRMRFDVVDANAPVPAAGKATTQATSPTKDAKPAK